MIGRERDGEIDQERDKHISSSGFLTAWPYWLGLGLTEARSQKLTRFPEWMCVETACSWPISCCVSWCFLAGRRKERGAKAGTRTLWDGMGFNHSLVFCTTVHYSISPRTFTTIIRLFPLLPDNEIKEKSKLQSERGMVHESVIIASLSTMNLSLVLLIVLLWIFFPFAFPVIHSFTTKYAVVVPMDLSVLLHKVK